MTMTDRRLLIVRLYNKSRGSAASGGMKSDRGWYNEVARWYNRLIEGAETCYEADLQGREWACRIGSWRVTTEQTGKMGSSYTQLTGTIGRDLLQE